MVSLREWGLSEVSKRVEILKIETFVASFMGLGVFRSGAEEGGVGDL